MQPHHTSDYRDNSVRKGRASTGRFDTRPTSAPGFAAGTFSRLTGAHGARSGITTAFLNQRECPLFIRHDVDDYTICDKD
jgi:hypothetical protein